MKKEIAFAIFAGILLGVMIAFGVWRANNALKPATDENTADISPTQAVTAKNNAVNNTAGLTITSPDTGDVLTDTPVLIKGLTHPNATVIISGENDDYMITADQSGQFEKAVPLIGGINQLLVSANDSTGLISNVSMNVVYSTEFNK